VAEIHVEFDNEAIIYEQFSPKRDMTKYGFFDRFKPVSKAKTTVKRCFVRTIEGMK
jgi:hypothetical protein